MNDQTTKLIETLATKLGTTSEYLWSILLRQAPISATIDLIFIAFTMIFGVILFRANKYLYKDSNKMSYDRDGEFLILPMIILGLIFIVCTLGAIASVNDVLNGYFNPEFWAIDYILNQLKQ